MSRRKIHLEEDRSTEFVVAVKLEVQARKADVARDAGGPIGQHHGKGDGFPLFEAMLSGHIGSLVRCRNAAVVFVYLFS